MASYDTLGKFYDAIMGDQSGSAKKIYELIKKFHTEAQSVLELGCGTGSYLHYLSKYYSTTGIDKSSVMLTIAREKLPGMRLYQTSMLDFNLNKRFDIIICMNDTFNHFLRVSDIRTILSKADKHLTERGILIFDINTQYKLNTLSHCAPIVHQFDENYLITNVSRVKKDIYEWDLRIFEHIKNNNYRLYEELLYERSYTISQLQIYLKRHFKGIKLIDLNQRRVNANSQRIHFICTKK